MKDYIANYDLPVSSYYPIIIHLGKLCIFLVENLIYEGHLVLDGCFESDNN